VRPSTFSARKSSFSALVRAAHSSVMGESAVHCSAEALRDGAQEGGGAIDVRLVSDCRFLPH